MAVDEALYRATESLILPSPRKFYRAAIHAHHWQLRSLISSPHGDYVYYPTGSLLYRMNTRTCTRELITTISFPPRCLSAARGWISCGGEEGQFAVVRLVEGAEAHGDNLHTVSADSRLPLNLESLRRSIDWSNLHQPATPDTKERSFVRTKKIGGEIVNCVTFWFPPPNPSAELYDAPVVVLANNDHTITVADLQTSDELQTIKFDDCINRAVISPDGKLLIAIGDDPFMYVYLRDLATPRGQFSTSSNIKSEWKQAHKIQLIGQTHSDKADTRGSFAAGFSKSGKYLAVGTQYGIISIFDTTKLADPEADPLITAFTTSRPNSKRGAVRDIEFSPEPYDLLTWTENTGRIGVADARDNFMSRQIIIVDSRAEGMVKEQMGPKEQDETALIPDRATGNHDAVETRNLMGDAEAGRSDSPDLLSAEIRRARDLNDTILERLQPSVAHGETASAIQVLQALQEQRRAREALREAEAALRNPSATMSGARVTSATLNRYRDLLADRSANPSGSSTVPSILTMFTNSANGERNASLRAYISERNQERERRQQQPRRRGSIILDATGRPLERESRDLRTARTSQSEANSQDGLTRLPPRLPPFIVADSNNSAWAELEDLYNIAVDIPLDVTARLRIEAEDERRLRSDIEDVGLDHARRASQREHERRSAFLLGTGYSTRNRVDPDETCGCCWSHDGRILFVGTESGIFEYHVNTSGRKFFPSLIMR